MTSVLILGAGGHTKAIIDCLCLRDDIDVIGIVDINPEMIGKHLLGIPIIDSAADWEVKYPPAAVYLINAIGSVMHTRARAMIFTRYKNKGYQFLTVIHPTAYVGCDVVLGEGVQLMAGSIVQTGCCIGDNVLVNTQAGIDHDCCIGDHVHIAPGVTCCGQVTIGNRVHVGCGAVIIQSVNIADDCLIGAGAVVIQDVSAQTKVVGVPAKLMNC